MTIIKVMDEALSNKIAAGEVVERPQSIVKELVENALDAKATKVKVQIESSGIDQIIVEDNGAGMAHEDALLAFQRHATSKIFSEDDLFSIRSLGFRGEALAAIAAVSQVDILTGKKDAQEASHIRINGGKFEIDEKVSPRIGTRITVAKLFYNTPARLKHLRSLQTEYTHIMEYLQKMALARPEVRFEFISDGRPIFKTFGTNKVDETLIMIYGEKIAPFLLPFEVSNEDFHVHGFISKPQSQRSHHRVINLSINKRSIRHFGINRAILSGYSTLIPKGMYPIVALEITVDPKLVDVNVHPSKLEVRLSKEREIEDLIKRKVSEILVSENLIYRNVEMPRRVKETSQLNMTMPNAKQPRQVDQSGFSYPNRPQSTGAEHSSQLTRPEQEAVKDIYGAANDYEAITQAYSEKTSDVAEEQLIFKENKLDDLPIFDQNQVVEDVQHSSIESQPLAPVEVSVDERVAPTESPQVTARDVLQELDIIGQYDATYILAQRDHSLYLIDQHAAQERIKYEEHMESVRKMEQITTQELLFPLTMRVTSVEFAAIKDFEEELVRSGIHLEVFGHQDIRVNSVPSWIKKEDIEVYIRRAIDVLVRHGKVDSAVVRENELIMLSCKYSIKAHDVLSKAEMVKLIQRLSEMKVPFTCPHGRPIVIEHTKYEVERWFKRV